MERNLFKLASCLVAAVMVMASCSTDKKSEASVYEMVECDSVLKFSSLFKSYKAIQLQAPQNQAVISTIDRLIFANQRIYVVDCEGNHIVCFNEDGEFICSTDRYKGHASNEYNEISDAVYDKDEQKIYALCWSPDRLLIFDMELKVIQAEDLDFNAEEIGLDGKNLVFQTHSFSTELNKSMMGLIAIDKHNLKAEPIQLREETPFTLFYEFGGKELCSDKKGCLACKTFSNEILRIKDGVVTESFTLDFKDKWFSGETTTEPEAFVKRNEKKIWGLDGMKERGSYILFNTGPMGHLGLLNKESKSFTMYVGLENDMILCAYGYGMNSTQGLENSIVYIGELSSQIEEIEKQELVDSVALRLAQEQKKWENPIIFVWELKPEFLK